MTTTLLLRIMRDIRYLLNYAQKGKRLKKILCSYQEHAKNVRVPNEKHFKMFKNRGGWNIKRLFIKYPDIFAYAWKKQSFLYGQIMYYQKFFKRTVKNSFWVQNLLNLCSSAVNFQRFVCSLMESLYIIMLFIFFSVDLWTVWR